MVVVRSRLAIRRLTGAIGAEITGVDLSTPDKTLISALREALLENLVLVFRDQRLSVQQHRDLGLCFGSLVVHPNLEALAVEVPEVLPFAQGRGAEQPPEFRRHADTNALRWSADGSWTGRNLRKSANNQWHSDLTCEELPPMGSILYCLESPPVGGDTLWANQYLAYETLPLRTKAFLDGQVAIHTNAANVDLTGHGSYQTTEHPVVRTHPETRRKALYVNRVFTSRIQGLYPQESNSLLAFLYEHSTRPDFCCRLAWEAGTVAFWDNRCTMHYAVDDYHDYGRLMHRITIGGDKPY
jgi:taurine dioxygenase